MAVGSDVAMHGRARAPSESDDDSQLAGHVFVLECHSVPGAILEFGPDAHSGNTAMYIPDNEGKACDAIVLLLERQTNYTRANVRFPEKDRIGPPVDMRFKLGGQEYAIEHTRIETFKAQIDKGVLFTQISKRIGKAFVGQLPGPANYTLNLPMNPFLDARGKQFDRRIDALIACVREQASILYEGIVEALPEVVTRRDLFNYNEFKPTNFPYCVTLYCRIEWPRRDPEPGSLRCVRTGLEKKELHMSLINQLKTSLENKCPKLRSCGTEGARTILILESDDIAHDVLSPVTERLSSLLAKRSDAPKEIFLVETESRTWWVWLLKCDESYRLMDDSGAWDPVTVRVDELNDLKSSHNLAKP